MFKKNNIYINNTILISMIYLIFAILCRLISPNNSFAENLGKYRRQIQEELIYPRECRYEIPTKLPIKDAANKFKIHIEIAKRLEKARILKLTQDNTYITMLPSENTYDIIQQNLNMRYELISFNLRLGLWDVEVHSAYKEGDKLIIIGKKVIKNKTRIYSLVMKAFPNAEKKKYFTMPTIWEITRQNGRLNIIEKSGK